MRASDCNHISAKVSSSAFPCWYVFHFLSLSVGVCVCVCGVVCTFACKVKGVRVKLVVLVCLCRYVYDSTSYLIFCYECEPLFAGIYV